MEKNLSEYPFKCKYCGTIGLIYPIHYCETFNGVRDIAGKLGEDTIDLTKEEKKKWDLVHNPTFIQRIKKLFK